VAVAFVLALLIVSSLAVLVLFAPSGAHPASAASAGGLRPDSAYGHGDLTVLPGQTIVLSPGTTGSTVYYEAGNISVEKGGTLIVDDLTIDWVQFIGSSGTVAQRLSNVFWFGDAGTVILSQSTITTDPFVLNAFVKLNVTVTGKMMIGTHSTIAFPGWINVNGGSLFLNNSVSTNNSQVGTQILEPAVLQDEEYSPALQAVSGGHIFIGGSLVENYYADDYDTAGVPGATVVGNNETMAPDYHWAGLNLQPPVAQGIAQAYAWESTPIAGGALQIGYLTSASYSATSGNSITFDSTSYSLGTINFPSAAAGAVIDVPLGPSGVITAINTGGGAAAFLQDSGQFGTASSDAVSLGFDLSDVNVTSLSVVLYPTLQYNISVAGSGSSFTAVDSDIGVNFGPVPGTPVTMGTPAPTPWGSNKLLVSGTANAYLGNVTVSGAPFAPFNDSSAVIPSGTSQAYFYQWLEVPITGGLNKAPVANGTTSVAYAGTNATLGATVAGLNDLAATDPYLASYVSQALADKGMVPSTSAGAGMAWSMLLSTIVEQTLLPSGQFVGTYNVTVTVPPGGAGEVTHVAASLTPYPQVVSPGQPFTSPAASFPNYVATLGITGSTSLVANALNTTVSIGQQLTVNVDVKNTGTAPTNNYTVILSYPESAGYVQVASSGLITAPLSAGANATVPVHWVVNETVTGLKGLLSFPVTFAVSVIWNGGLPDGGTNSTLLKVTITPAIISLTYTPPTGRLPFNGAEIDGSGVATYAGKGAASITVLAVGHGQSYVLYSGSTTNNTTFETDITAATGMPKGTSYTLEVEIAYNGRAETFMYGTITTAGTAATPNILTMKILFFPLWMWLVIAAIIIAAVLGVMFGLGRFARGRLVECGECGNLIPEDATVCPKCGAEFESDLVRCSRCGSTIPSTSAVCPECAATLLARAGPESADPERQSYADFVERFRTEAKKELGANYSEGAFWDWWKRQPSYVSFSQWRLQQAQGTRSGMTAPVMTEAAPATTQTSQAPPRRPPPGGVPPGARAAPAAGPAVSPRAAPPARTAPAAAPVAQVPAPAAPAAAPVAPAATPAMGMKNCPNCGKQINADFLVCPFCGSVTG
jgi:RNA polymerase subunit RPABC4/transcription elongation factor Spt4